MTGDTGLKRRARDSLGLRSPALGWLAGDTLGPDSSGPSGGGATSRPEAWPLFLRAERCARPLVTALERSGRLGELPRPASEVLRDRAQTESRRILMARARLAELQEVARKTDHPVVVLKGGVLLSAGERALVLGDLDVLVPEGTEDGFAARLRAAGYRARPEGDSPHHLPLHEAPGGVPVEIHRALRHDGVPPDPDLWERLRPLEGFSPLQQLGPADHGWHVLRHSAADHPHGRGELRELLLLAAALEDCTAEELKTLRQRLAEHPSASALDDQLAMAGAVAGGRAVEDRFRDEAAARYLLWQILEPAGMPALVTGPMFAATAARLGAAADREQLFEKAALRPPGSSAVGPIAAVEGPLPRLGWVVRRTLRRLRLGLLLLLARPVAWWARRIARSGPSRRR